MLKGKQKSTKRKVSRVTTWPILWYVSCNWWKKEVLLPDGDRFHHLYMIWQTWTWKSNMILKQAISDIYRWCWICLFDTYWDLSETILQYYPKERIDDLIYFDLSNTEYPVWFNILEWGDTDEERELLVNNIVDMFVDMYWQEMFGPRIQDYFRNACLLLSEQHNHWNFLEIMGLFSDVAFAKTKTDNIKNPLVDYRWNTIYPKMWDREKQEIIPFIQAKLSPFTTSKYIHSVIWQLRSSFNFEKVMQEKKVVICKFPKWIVWEKNTTIMCKLLLMQLQQAIVKRGSMPGKDRTPFFIYMDDFYQYVPNNFWEFLHNATKYNVGVTMTNQYIDQLKFSNSDISKIILNNVGTILAFRVWNLDAEYLEKCFYPEFSTEDLKALEKYVWIIKVSSNWIQWKPFLINTEVDFNNVTLNDKKKMDLIKKISSLHWWTKRSLVDKELRYVLRWI